VGDGAADGTSEGEARVEGEAGKLARLLSLDVLDDGIELGRAGGLCGSRHCEGVVGRRRSERREYVSCLGRRKAESMDSRPDKSCWMMWSFEIENLEQEEGRKREAVAKGKRRENLF
jgi:hypothetical protein